MLYANYFMVTDNNGDYLIGRTDSVECGPKPCITSDGSPGIIVIAPAYIIESFRSDWILNHQWGAFELLDNKISLWLTKQAILRWIDIRRVQEL